MTIEQLQRVFMTKTRREALSRLLTEDIDTKVALTGLSGSSAACVIASLPKGEKPYVVIGSDADDAGYLYHDLSRLVGEEKCAMLPSAYKRDIKYGQVDAPSVVLRTETLNRTANEEGLLFVVTYPDALAEKVASRKQIDADTITLRVSEKVNFTKLCETLREKDFREVDYVYEPGSFAVRGSILDVFGYGSEVPVRVDFFGNEIDSIRTFNVETQLSETRMERTDIVADVDARTRENQSFFSFVGTDAVVLTRLPDRLISRVEEITTTDYANATRMIWQSEGSEERTVATEVADPERLGREYASMRKIGFTAAPEALGFDVVLSYGCTPQGLYHKNFDLISETFGKWLSEGYKIYILSDNEKQFERLKSIFADRHDAITFEGVLSTLHAGFIDRLTKTCVLTDHQIFDRFHKYTLKSDRARSGRIALSIKELNSLEPGDYVVHVDHGVGKFAGLLRTETGGHTQEMIKLVYQNNDILFVSIHSLHKLAKYRGKEGVPPTLNRIGSGSWQRLKERTKTRLKDIARDLINLYAARREQKGYAFSPDSYLQHELEASFVYEDTPDQLSATQAVKSDMESEKPMDRLICGDVGFGKTEIAIRAAFKAATDSKQVAVLVPTTVLALQHFNTFSERLKDFPVRVDYLSRARTSKQVQQIRDDLAKGKIDIIIGTHRLIGKTINFKDLGLLIVDEEQKFGVAVKEKLRQMKVTVDTLTMSATPIPRTLQFSLMGARDLSSINTPPPNRYPIMTTVTSEDDDMIKEAINFEMARSGQVFYVNNRIEGLYDIEKKLRRLVPDARVVVAHGQMPPEELERAIMDFSAHDYDVLLSTTIIESGIDMPRVNTIIVNNAHRFGLSELHQLRGRVGRSTRKAFCYLLVPSGVPLTDVARRRLQAIESFSDLGSGIHIAMQDLDIRGAGNLLGAEQSGFISDLGYETYQKILKEAVIEVRGEAGVVDKASNDIVDSEDFVAECSVETDLELLLPADYVPQTSERIALYQELDSIERDDELRGFSERLRDRFGKIPPEAEELLEVPRLRRLARRLGIEKVNIKGGTMYIYFVGEENKAYYMSSMFGRILTYLNKYPRRVRIRQNVARQSFAIGNVGSVSEGVSIFREMLSLNPV